MKKISIAILSITMLIACKSEPEMKDYVTLSGKVENKQDSLLVINSQQYNKEIRVNEDGTFKDTLKVEENFYLLTNGMSRTVVKLKNGYDLNIKFDAQDVLNTSSFSGLGANTNNYMADKMRLQKEFDFDQVHKYFELQKPEFDRKIENLKISMSDLLEKAEGLDSTFTSNELRSNEQFLKYLLSNYEAQHAILAPIAKGMPSPKFSYPDINGKKVSLDDLKGNFVYIDVWATWCTPCLREIPYLKELEKEYHAKNIKFVSLSIDKQEVKDKWKKMVVEKELTGIQIMADKDWESDFIAGYGITAIPRFLLIDPEGNIVSNNAPRPSDPELKKLFTELSI